MFILQRTPYDEFTLRQFIQLSNSLSVAHDAFYIVSPMFDKTMWSREHYSVLNRYSNLKFSSTSLSHATPPDFFKNIIKNNIQENTVLLGTKDHYTGDYFNPWNHTKPSIILDLEEIFLEYPNTNFILFTSVENLEAYLNLPNVKIVPWGGDITNQSNCYKSVDPVLDKNVDSNKTFLCLNRNHRYHRELILSLLLDSSLEDFGIMSCMFQEKLISTENEFFKFNSDQQSLKESFIRGRKKLINYNFPINDDYAIYKTFNNDNVDNFKNKLVDHYKNTFIEIIVETSYFEDCFLVTEKTANSIHGCNFPIWISSAGTVKFLKSTGLDVFDDIIDHSYDSIEDPLERASAAIKLNSELLSNSNKVSQLWLDNKHRFENNSIFLKSKFLDYYRDRTFSIFNNCVI